MPPRPATPSDDERPTKKTKISSEAYFDDLSKEVDWLDIEPVLASTPEDETEPGWIAGDIFMVFKSKQKSEAQLISRNMQLKISILGPEHQRFKFSFRQSLRVSLRGASILKLKSGTSAPGYMPFSLVFKNGAAVKFLAGEGEATGDGMVVDSWQRETSNDDSHSEEDWFQVPPTAPRANTESCVAARASSVSAPSSSSHSSPFPETPGRNSGVVPYESSVTISNGIEEEELAMDMEISDLQQSVPTSHAKTPPRGRDTGNKSDTSTRDGSRVKKRDMRHDPPQVVLTESSSDTRESESGGLAKELTTREKRRLKRMLTRKPKQISQEPPTRNPNLDLSAGLSTGSDAYPALTELLKNSFVHIIGVVACIEPIKTSRRGDFCLTLTLVDPSKFQNGAGFKVTLFMKSGSECLLPSAAEKGHALLLRNVRTAEWMNNINGTVYPDRLKWIGYNPDTGKVYHPEVRSEENTSDCTFDALYLPKDDEMRYLVQLAGWWRAVRDEEERGAIEIGDCTRRRRDHRLIGSCDVDQFFNATVEILRLEQAESGQTIIFFTDYTPHRLRSTGGYYGQWAVHASTGMIDQSTLDTMKPGTYWSIDNMRLRIGSSGSLEAELYAANLWERDSDADDAYLRELLKRKEAYLKEHPQNPGQYDTAESPISGISQAGHYNIIAELVYRSKPRDAVMDLFVTDYTDNKLLSSYKPEGLKRQLAGSPVTVLQITCWDGQEFVRDMEIGRVYSFCDVRMREQESGLKGNLKFVDKRVTRMSVRKTDNEAVLALLQRKKEFEASVGGSGNSSLKSSEEQKPSPVISSPCIESRYQDLPLNTIAEIRSAVECPKKFRLVARIVDFFPIDICDFAVRWCTNCMSRIPDNYNACMKCEDFMEEYVKWLFSFWFMLEDKKGKRLVVDGGIGSKYLTQDLEPCDLRENHDALWALKRRLRGYLGNLVEVHEGLKREEVIEAQYAPYLDLAVRSWEVAERDNKVKFYALTGFEGAELSNHPDLGYKS